jgi:hypothetical protein
MQGQIETGSVEGLNDFCSWVINKGLMTSSAVEPLRSATKQIIATVEPEADPAAVNVADPSFDPDQYMDRFERIAGSKYAPDSLNAYRRRFKRAIELYRQYIENGAANFKPPAGRPARQRAQTSNGSNARTASGTGGKGPTTPPPAMIQYPFPLTSGEVAQLTLPPRLHKDDADRLMRFVQALVFEPQRQIGPGADEQT